MECPACHTENKEDAKYCAKCGAALPQEKDPLIGRKIKDTFLIKRLLGEGGMGRVYEAEQQMGNTTRKVAVKTLHTELSRDPNVVKRFYRECEVVVQLEHPNTIKFYDFGEITDEDDPNAPKQLFIAMEFLNGESVESVLEREGKMAPDRVLNIMEQVCGSLAEAHEKGVIHRDLKPDNIQLTNRAGVKDFVKVLDFGIAHKDAGDNKEQKLTQQGMVLGTPPYMSPEQFTGKELDGRSDIYSLGVMTYEMLTGRLPFDADGPWEWATKHLTEQPYPFEVTAQQHAAYIPEHMKRAVMRALAKDREQRQQDVKQFLKELKGEDSMASAGTPVPSSGGGSTGTTAMEAPPPELLQAAAAAAPAAPVGAPVPPMAAPAAAPMASGPSPMPSASYPGPQPTPTTTAAGGSNKGLLIALAGLGGLALVVGLIFIVMSLRGSDDEEEPSLSAIVPSATAVASIAPIGDDTANKDDDNTQSDETPPATAKTTKPARTSHGSHSTAPKKKGPQGEAACRASIAAAHTGNIVYAVQLYRVCTKTGGHTGGQAKAAIRSNAASAARRARFNHNCAQARRIARAASSIGADGGATAEANKCK